MAKNLIVINVDIRETRVALIENGIIAELHIERAGSSASTLGNIYLGKVSRVLPGMQAAFIDIGEERAAFLHVEDLIRPDDFEAYLAGHRHSKDESGRSAGRAAPPGAEKRSQPEAQPVAGAAEDEAEVAAPPEADDREAEEPAEILEAEGEELVSDSDEIAAAEGLEDGIDFGSSADDGEAVEASDEDREDADVDERADSDDDSVPDADVVDTMDADAADAAAEDEPAADDEEDAAPAVDEDEEEERAALDDEDAEREDAERAADEDEEAEPAAEPADASVEGAADDEDSEAPEVAAEGEPAEAAAAEGSAPEAAADGTAAPNDARGRNRTRRGGRGRRRRRSTDVQANAAATPAAPPKEPANRQQQERAPREAARVEAAPRERRDRHGRNDRRGRNKEQTSAPRAPVAAPAAREGRVKDPLRVSKSTPIREVVREGQEVVVQVSKEPIGTKGARVTSHVSLPGRYVVYLPTVEHVGISKRIGSDKERARLREAIDAMKPPQGGLIVRTLAEGLTKKSLKADVGYLVRLWGEIMKRREQVERAPACLYSELDIVLKAARDLFTDDVERIVIDSPEEHARLRRFVEMFMPERASAVELYEGDEPIFDAYGIEEEIGRALLSKVPLPSGGHLVIDQAEALTAIDVNTGRFVGKGSRDLEDTILQTNLEAVEEIAYQLRFRNIGGLIILDLIDMEKASNREKVRRRLEQLLARDKAKTTLNRISDLGLIEMTRKRTRESLGRIMNEPCFYCDGTGSLQSRQTIAYEILRQIKRERMSLRGYNVVVNAHPAVVDYLKSEERAAVQDAERRYMRRIELVARKEYHLEQFDLVGK
ncbi:MAG: Rne/Rng family ribonuclease [Polyangiaceae bacterium]